MALLFLRLIQTLCQERCRKSTRHLVRHLFAGVDDGKTGEKALCNSLLHNLKSSTDERLRGNNGGESCQYPHGIEGSMRQTVPEDRSKVFRVLHQIRPLPVEKPGCRGRF